MSLGGRLTSPKPVWTACSARVLPLDWAYVGINNRDRRKVKKKPREQRQQRFAATGSIQQVSPVEAVEMLVDGAVNAVGRNDPDHAARAAAALADISVAGQLLLSYLQNAVAHAWRFGWQPADLLRQAARMLPAGGEQMMLDAVA